MFTERQPKRLRASTSPIPGDAHNRYLDTVSDDSLRIILRYLSRRPQHHNWHSYTSPHSVRTALDVGGALGRAALSEFQYVGGKDGVPLDTDADALILRPLFYRLPLRRLVVRLDGEEIFADALRGCGAELRELVVHAAWTLITKSNILAISIHCTKLSSLAIRGHYYKSPLAPIWRSLGSTLTRIYIGHYYSDFRCRIESIILVPDLVEHCVNLRHVDVVALNNAIVDVFFGLGNRIRVLCIENQLALHIDPWREVFRACTSLEAVDLNLTISEQGTDVLSLVRTKLVCLALHHPDNQGDQMPNEDRFFSVLSTCSVLKKSNTM